MKFPEFVEVFGPTIATRPMASIEQRYADTHDGSPIPVSEKCRAVWRLLNLTEQMVDHHHSHDFRATVADLWADARPPQPRHGNVRLEDHAFADDGGVLLGFGATLMWALWGSRYFRARLQQNLDWLAQRGLTYIRILTEVGGDFWHDREIDPGWDNYFVTFDDLFVDVAARGLRVEVTVFGDVVNFMTTQSARIAWVEQMAACLALHRADVQFVEIANESGELGAGGIGLSDRDLAELTRLWKSISEIPVAPSSPGGGQNPEEGLERLFREQDITADLLTPHFQRVPGEEGYRPHRQPWEVQHYGEVDTTAFVNDEGVGPSRGDSDPARLAMGMANTYIARGAGFNLHTGAGVRGDYDFWEEENIEPIMTALRSILHLVPAGIPNGTPKNHHWDGHPYRDEDGAQIWPVTGGDGVVRAYASEVDGAFYVAVMGVKGAYRVTAQWSMRVEVFDPRTGLQIADLTLDEGQTLDIRPMDDGLRDFLHRITRT